MPAKRTASRTSAGGAGRGKSVKSAKSGGDANDANHAKEVKRPNAAARGKRYWLVKSEPSTFSFDDLMGAPRRTTGWDGVRNYQARNYMRDDMKVGDGVLFYHSSAEPPAIAGIAEVAREAYPDPTQFDPKSEYHDPKSKRDAPTWVQVDIRAVEALPRPLTLDELRKVKALAGMELLRKGSRLSVQPVTEEEWEGVMGLVKSPASRGRS